MPKPIVRYRGGDLAPIEVGKSAHVYVLDHPDQRLNYSVYGVQTSTVVRADEDGTFETLNSIYVPAEKAHEG